MPLSGQSLAVYNSSGLAYYRHPDWLGSSRFASTPGRALYFDGAYAPFGENYAETGTTDLSFTGMNQDTVSNLFDFPAREYNPVHGRWPSPDPAGISAVRLKDPQTFNRYSYVRNNPLSRVDPLVRMMMTLMPPRTGHVRRVMTIPAGPAAVVAMAAISMMGMAIMETIMTVMTIVATPIVRLSSSKT